MKKKIWLPNWKTGLSAALYVFAFPPWNLWPLIWLSLVPWILTLKKTKTVKAALIQGFWLCYLVSFMGFFWIAFVLKEFGNLNSLLSFLGLQLFCLGSQPQFIAFAGLYFYLNQFKSSTLTSDLGKALAGAVIYSGLDWGVPKLFQDTLGHAFYLATYLRQVVDLSGIYFLTFLGVFINFTLLQLFERRERLFKSPRLLYRSPTLVAGLVLCLLTWIYGYFRTQHVHEIVKQSTTQIQVAAIQANIGDFDKIAAERGVIGAAEKVIDTYSDLTQEALRLSPRPEVIVWPETSYPSTFRNPHTGTESHLDQRLEDLARQSQIPFLFGGYDQKNSKDFNAFFFLDPHGKLEIYRKSILLLFGEYIPGSETFQFLKDAFPQVGNFGRGEGPEVFSVRTRSKNVPILKIGPIICYEVLFTHFVREAANRGSQLILNITNDSWFGPFGEPQLHLALSTFRSIETRLPMLRSTNTGISALILPDGEITHATRIGEPEILNVTVPITEPIPTGVKRWGNWFGGLVFFLGFWVMLFGIYPELTQRTRGAKLRR